MAEILNSQTGLGEELWGDIREFITRNSGSLPADSKQRQTEFNFGMFYSQMLGVVENQPYTGKRYKHDAKLLLEKIQPITARLKRAILRTHGLTVKSDAVLETEIRRFIELNETLPTSRAELDKLSEQTRQYERAMALMTTQDVPLIAAMLKLRRKVDSTVRPRSSVTLDGIRQARVKQAWAVSPERRSQIQSEVEDLKTTLASDLKFERSLSENELFELSQLQRKIQRLEGLLARQLGFKLRERYEQSLADAKARVAEIESSKFRPADSTEEFEPVANLTRIEAILELSRVRRELKYPAAHRIEPLKARFDELTNYITKK